VILHEADPDTFRAAIQSTAEALSIREVYVEKDYRVTLLLKRLSLQSFKRDIVFKGGTLHRYPRIAGGEDFGQATDKLILEINSFADPDPAGAREIRSYIGDHLAKVAPESLSEYELAPFSICVPSES
jgi:hypothetical protein